MRCGSVSIVGRTNVGKSTFLNAALGQPLAITSSRPQTTRDLLLGVVHRQDAQIAFVDTPGLHRPRTELGRRMNASAVDSARSSDAALFMVEARGIEKRIKLRALPQGSKDRLESLLLPDDQRLLQIIPKDIPTLVAINKVDLLKDKTALLPLMQEVSDLPGVVAVLPVSVKHPAGAEAILNALIPFLPEQDAPYDAEHLTDRPTTFFAREYIREQIMRATDREVPHAVAVTIDSFKTEDTKTRISATIHVEKAGQRGILLGTRGAKIKEIGIAARERIEELLQCHVRLDLFVRVSERWKDMPRQLSELGYDGDRGLALSSALPARPEGKSRPAKPKQKLTIPTGKGGRPGKPGTKGGPGAQKKRNGPAQKGPARSRPPQKGAPQEEPARKDAQHRSAPSRPTSAAKRVRPERGAR